MQGYRTKEVITKEVLGKERGRFKIMAALLKLLNRHTCYRNEAGMVADLTDDKEDQNDDEEAIHFSQAVGGKEEFWVADEVWATDPIPKEMNPRAFASYFVTPKACQLASTQLRKLVSIDGCHTASAHGLVILTAVGYDADGGIFPLAWAVLTGENYRYWSWFLLQLKLAYP